MRSLEICQFPEECEQMGGVFSPYGKNQKNLILSFIAFVIIAIIILPNTATAAGHTITFNIKPTCGLNVISLNEVVVESNIP